jgi:hypothetical protein
VFKDIRVHKIHFSLFKVIRVHKVHFSVSSIQYVSTVLQCLQCSIILLNACLTNWKNHYTFLVVTCIFVCMQCNELMLISIMNMNTSIYLNQSDVIIWSSAQALFSSGTLFRISVITFFILFHLVLFKEMPFLDA